MADRSDIRDAARLELSTTIIDVTTWPDAELNRAVDEVTADITRLMPEQKITEIYYAQNVDGESFTSSHDAFVALANSPIKPKSETVTSDPVGTTYVRGTDYEMDYAAGEIKVLSSGSMANTTGFLISYDRSAIAFDISSLTDMLQLIAVEWPLGDVPQSKGAGFWVWDDKVWVETSIRHGSQTNLADKESIRLYYTAQHTAPTDSAVGSFPRFLDEVMVKGVVAYALFIKHREQVLQGVTDSDLGSTALAKIETALVKARTALAAVTTTTTGPQDKMNTALGNITTDLTAITTALNKVATHIGEAGTALAKVATHSGTQAVAALDKVDTHLAGVSDSAKAALAKVTTHSGTEAAAALAKVETHLNAAGGAKTALDKVADQLTGATDSVKEALDKIDSGAYHASAETAFDLVATFLDLVHNAAGTTGDLENAELVWADELKHILNQDAGATPSAELHLELGDPLINKVNLGSQVAELRRRYGEAALGMAQMWDQKRKDFFGEANLHVRQAVTYLQEGQGRMNQVAQLIAEASGWAAAAELWVREAAQRVAMAQGFIGEAGQRNAMSQAFIGEAAQRIATGQGFIAESAQRNAVSQAFIAEAANRIAMARGYMEEAQGRATKVTLYFREAEEWVAKGGMYIREADGWFTEANRVGEEARNYLALADARSALADKLLSDARERHADYWSILTDRTQKAQQRSMSSVRQYPEPSGRRSKAPDESGLESS